MRKPIPISELLAQGKAKLERLKTGAETANRTLVALQQALPADAAGHVWGASLDEDGVLTVLTDSGSWASRIRYAVPDLTATVEAAVGSAVRRTIVRVKPRRG